MPSIRLSNSGSTQQIEKFLKGMDTDKMARDMEKFGRQGRDALAAATPVDSGETANSWGYEVVVTKDSVKIIWTNGNVIDGFPVAIGLQYGYATGTGGYVYGRDYINPAIRPTMDRISQSVWKAVTSG